ncbi:MAG: hypothetical protein N2749_03855 [Clostridia bacterium]|nr:hypothetical protein [Clostridia bacterium]
MASYDIHIAVAKRFLEINDEIRYDENSKLHFFLGTIAPDLIASKYISRDECHFDRRENRSYVNIDLDYFVDKYSKLFNIPFVLGYYIHLYTDQVFYNEYMNTRIKLIEKNVNVFNYKYLIVDSNKIITLAEICSTDGIYSDYDMLNDFICKKFSLNFEQLKINFKEIIKSDISEAKLIFENNELNYNEIIKKLDITNVVNYNKDAEIKILSEDSISEFIENTAQKLNELLKEEYTDYEQICT